MTFSAVLLLVTSATAAEEKAPLTLEKTIPLPGVEGRFDHLAADGKARRLYVAALGNGTLEAISLDDGKRAGSIASLKEPQGVLVLAETGQVAVASGKDGKLKVFDGVSLKLLQELDAGEDADNVRFDASSRRVYVGCEKSLAVVDSVTWLKVGKVPLDGHAESFQIEKDGRRIFVNVPDAKHVAVVDREKGAVTETWKIEGAAANFPMALDESRHRLLVGCRQPAKIVAFDIATGRQTASIDVSGDMDDLFIDAPSGRVYASCGEGFVDVFETSRSGSMNRAARVATAPGARTALLVPDLKRFYLAVPHRGEQKAELRVFKVAGI